LKAKLGRTISIVGHPFILTPLAVVIATTSMSPQVRALILALLVAAMGAVAFYVGRGHRRGDLTDIDVSTREQRPGVFRVAIGSLCAVMLALYLTHSSPAAFRGATVANGLFVVCALVNRRIKASLHCAFAMLAAGIVFPANMVGGIAFAVAALVIGWGRVAYKRHTPQEVIVGLILGTIAAGTLVVWLSALS